VISAGQGGNVLKNNSEVKFLSKGDEDDSKNIEDSDKDSDRAIEEF
jgi:hypothetical protein